ncbi:hypothetical protein M422DRAFT_63076 [Sphaerobolus stellatus SS14]|nr:hypothetical protein M422DRAFT_63076 [Sphaerobolus stellatus SS14]
MTKTLPSRPNPIRLLPSLSPRQADKDTSLRLKRVDARILSKRDGDNNSSGHPTRTNVDRSSDDSGPTGLPLPPPTPSSSLASISSIGSSNSSNSTTDLQSTTSISSSISLLDDQAPSTTPSDISISIATIDVTLTLTRTINVTGSMSLTSWTMFTTVTAPLPVITINQPLYVGLMLAPTLGLLSLMLLSLLIFLLCRRRILSRRPAYGILERTPPGAYASSSGGRFSDRPEAKFKDNANWNVPLMRDVEAYGPDPRSTDPFYSPLDPRYEDPYDNGLSRLHRLPSGLSKALETESAYSRELESASIYSRPTMETASTMSTISSVPVPFYEKIKAARRTGTLNKNMDNNHPEEEGSVDGL